MESLTNKRMLVLVLPDTAKIKLFNFYEVFISLLKEYIQDKIIIIGSKNQIFRLTEGIASDRESQKNNSETPDTYYFQDNNVYWFIREKEVPNIRIRDYAPILFRDQSLKFRYNPSYFHTGKEKTTEILDRIGNELPYLCASLLSGVTLDKSYSPIVLCHSDLILDGGNCVFNEKGDAVISTRFFEENPTWGIKEAQGYLSLFGLNKIHFIEPKPSGHTGHVDGIVRFVDSRSVIVSALPDTYVQDGKSISRMKYEEDAEYLNQVAEYMSKYYNVTRLTNIIPRNEEREKISSSFGNYTNFLIFGDCLFVPQYGNELQDKLACETLAKAYQSLDPSIVKVDCTELASYGGGLNCITWEFQEGRILNERSCNTHAAGLKKH